MQKIQKSKSFILPMFYFPKFINPHIDTYLGCIPYEGDMNWGDYFYISCAEDCPDNVVSVLRKHSQYKTEFQFEDTYFYVFDITEKQKESIVTPFINGAYSKIDREYVARCFPKFNDLGNVSTN